MKNNFIIIKNVTILMIIILVISYCGAIDPNAPPKGEINFPVPTKMLVNTGEMQLGSSGAYRVQASTDTTAEPMPSCSDFNSDNTIFNLGFQMACSAGVILRQSLTGTNTGTVRCDDSTDDGIIGAIACNVPAKTVAMKPFAGDKANTAYALSFENFDGFTGAGVWTGNEGSLPLAMQLWMGADVASTQPGIALQLTDKTQGSLWVDYRVTEAKTDGGLLKGSYNTNTTTCSVTNINKTDCVYHEVNYVRPTGNCPSGADVKSVHVEAYADKTSSFTFAKVQYHVEMCNAVTPTNWATAIAGVRGNSMLVNGKRFLQIDLLDASGTPITASGVGAYDTSFLTPLLTAMGTASTGLCFPAGFNADQANFWGASQTWATVKGNKGIVDGQCDSTSVSFSTFGTGATDFQKANATNSAMASFNSTPTATMNQ